MTTKKKIPEPVETDGLQEVGIYRKRPIEVEATLYGGVNPPEGQATPETLMAWNCPVRKAEDWDGEVNQNIWIVTWEGDMLCRPGDWVIKGVAGEYYPCKAEIFAETYEPVG